MTVMSLTSAPSVRPRDELSPPARRPSRAGWRDPRLAVGVVLVALSVVVGVRVVEGRDDTVAVLAAARPLVAGQRLGEGDLAVVEVRFGSAQDADRYLLAAADSEVVGTVLDRGVGEGEMLPRAATGTVRTANAELPLAVPLGQVPAGVRTGSVVDVWATAGRDGVAVDDGRAADATRLLRAVPVLSVSRGQGLGPDSEIRLVVGVPDRSAPVGAVVRRLASSSIVLVHRPAAS